MWATLVRDVGIFISWTCAAPNAERQAIDRRCAGGVGSRRRARSRTASVGRLIRLAGYEEAARNRMVSGRSCYVCCGGVLLSHNPSVAVPLALPGLASRFGMEAGRFPGAMTTTSLVCSTRSPTVLVGVWVDRGLYSGCGCLFTVLLPTGTCVCGLLFSVGPLVPVGSRAPRGASTSGLSTR